MVTNNTIKIPCECGRNIKILPLRHITKEELEVALNQDVLPEDFLSKPRSKNKNGITFDELVEVLKQRIRPIEVICMHCHAVNNLENIIPSKYIATPYSHPGQLKHTWMI